MLDDESIAPGVDDQARHRFDQCGLFGLPAAAAKEHFVLAVRRDAHAFAIAEAAVIESEQWRLRVAGIIDVLACESPAIRTAEQDQALGVVLFSGYPVRFRIECAAICIDGCSFVVFDRHMRKRDTRPRQRHDACTHP
jgi:hypothetical protein